MQKKSENQTQKFDYLCKSIIVGDSGVGKTNIVLRFTEDTYKNSHTATIGVDFKIKTVNVDGSKVRLQVWDTAGQCKFRNITRTYFKGATGAIFAYAVNDRTSFQNISDWVRQANENSDTEQARILIANKADVPQEQRQISKREGEELARKYKMMFLEVSAKNGDNINSIFEEMARKMKDFAREDPKQKIVSDKPPRKQCC